MLHLLFQTFYATTFHVILLTFQIMLTFYVTLSDYNISSQIVDFLNVVNLMTFDLFRKCFIYCFKHFMRQHFMSFC